MTRTMMRLISIWMLLVMTTYGSIGCNSETQPTSSDLDFTSFREIPGVTADEIRQIEYLQEHMELFIYGMNQGTEAFEIRRDGHVEVRGFSALFCEWLTELFDITFIPTLIEWGPLLEGLADGSVDFTGEMMATPARREIYYMTDAIAERTMHIFRINGSKPLAEIAELRPVRYAFFEGSVAVQYVGPLINHAFEIVNYESYEEVYQALLSGEVDGFFDANTGEAAFESYLDIVKEDFFPLVYIPVSMSAQNSDLEVIISVVQKALSAGALIHLTGLYNQGYEEYQVYKLYNRLTAEEIHFIQENPKIIFGMSPTNYPISFYNTYTNEWQGIAVDVMEQVSQLTGMVFVNNNDQSVKWVVLLSQMENHEIQMLVDLTNTPEREGLFLWPNASFLTSRYALISKLDTPNIRINELLYTRVGVQKDSAQAELFKTWFPNLLHIVEFPTFNEAFAALEANEIDLLMADETRLLNIVNYQENVDYKINIVFDRSFDSTFAFHIEEPILTSIVEKALHVIDTNNISNQWMKRSFDYRSYMSQARLPWMIGISGLLLCVLVLLLVLLQIKRLEKGRLAVQVAERTNELVTMKEELERALSIAEDANNAKSDFLAKVSHEMRTPLNAIIGLSELELYKEDTEVNESIERINTAGSTLLNIVNDILDISKIEAGKFELVQSNYDVASLIFDTININGFRIGEKNINFIIQVDEEIPNTLYGDDLRIRQILNNILSNAMKYTNEGEVEFKVHGTYKEDQFYLVFQIRDTGVGFKDEEKERLFTNYFQIIGDPKRRVEGTGLGLAITKRLCDHMSGTISLESTFGVGSTFTIYIPQIVVSDHKIGADVTKNLSEFTYNNKRNKVSRIAPLYLPHIRVLIVDDVISNLDVARGMLARYQMHIDCVMSGREAIELIQCAEKRYDAIFMDHMMPEMDGIQATELIHSLDSDYARNLPVIALTANAIIGNEQMFLSKGFYAYLPKPIDIIRLDVIVRSLFKNGIKDEEELRDVQKRMALELKDQKYKDLEHKEVIHTEQNTVDLCKLGQEVLLSKLKEIHSIHLGKLMLNYEDDMDMISMILQSFLKNTPFVLQQLEGYKESSMKDYQICIHGLKSCCNNVCAFSLANDAYQLEQAAKEDNIDFIREHHEDFVTKIRDLLHQLEP